MRPRRWVVGSLVALLLLLLAVPVLAADAPTIMPDGWLTYRDVGLPPVIWALVGLVGLTPWGEANRKLLPALAAVLGILLGALIGVNGDHIMGLLYGILWAAGAVGVHSGAKNILEYVSHR